MIIKRVDLDDAFECVTVLCYLKPDATPGAILDSLLPPEEAAGILWPDVAKAGWIEEPHYVEGATFPGGLVFGTFEPGYRVLSLQAIAKPLPEGELAACR